MDILYEDEFLLVINKPYGIVVNRAESVKGETVHDWVESKFKVESPKFKDDESEFMSRGGIVHRIDKETSGCLLIAKNPEIFIALQKEFKDRIVQKEYVSLVHGKLVPQKGEITAPIGRLPWNRTRFGVVPEGKEAYTAFVAEKYFQDAKHEHFTFVRLFPKTGRTHQLRVHLKYLGFPIVGDYLYAGRKQQIADRIWCPRVFLHAAKIAFVHPVSQVEISVESKLPEELTKVINQLTPAV